MELQSDRFLVKEGNCFKLLCRDEQNLYLLPLGKVRGSDREKELKRLPVGQIVFHLKHWKGETIPLDTLRGIAPVGVQDNDLLYLLLSRGWRPLVLRQYLSFEYLEQFFPGIPQCQPPQENLQDKLAPNYWRLLEQDPVKRENLRWLEWFLALLALLAGGLFHIARSLPAFLLCALCVTVPVALDILFPAYFTLEPELKISGRVGISLSAPVLLVTAALLLARIQYPGFPWRLLRLSLVAAAVSTALMLLAKEFRKHKILLAGAYLLALLLSFGFLQHANELLPQPPPENIQVQVVQVRKKIAFLGVRREVEYTFHCVVELPDQTRLEARIGHTTYRSLSKGRPLVLHKYQGALGIEYFTLTYPGQIDFELNQ